MCASLKLILATLWNVGVIHWGVLRNVCFLSVDDYHYAWDLPLSIGVDSFSPQSKHQLNPWRQILSLYAQFFIIKIYSQISICSNQVPGSLPLHLLIQNYIPVLSAYPAVNSSSFEIQNRVLTCHYTGSHLVFLAIIAQSVGAIEYTDCRRVRFPQRH